MVYSSILTGTLCCYDVAVTPISEGSSGLRKVLLLA